MNILITGSTGFVGRSLIPALLTKHANILEVTRNIEASQKLFGDKTRKCLITDDQELFIKAIVNKIIQNDFETARYFSFK